MKSFSSANNEYFFLQDDQQLQQQQQQQLTDTLLQIIQLMILNQTGSENLTADAFITNQTILSSSGGDTTINEGGFVDTRYLEIAYQSFFVLFGTPINLYCLYRSLKNFRKTGNGFISRRLKYVGLNIIIVDLIILIPYSIGKTAWLITYFWYGGPFLCKLWTFLSTFGYYLWSYLAVFSAADMLYCLAYPLRSRKQSRSAVKVNIGICWLAATLFSCPQFYVWEELAVPRQYSPGYADQQYQCIFRHNLAGWILPTYQIFHTLTIFYIPLAIIIMVYLSIGMSISKRKLSTAAQSSSTIIIGGAATAATGKSSGYSGSGSGLRSHRGYNNATSPLLLNYRPQDYSTTTTNTSGNINNRPQDYSTTIGNINNSPSKSGTYPNHNNNGNHQHHLSVGRLWLNELTISENDFETTAGSNPVITTTKNGSIRISADQPTLGTATNCQSADFTRNNNNNSPRYTRKKSSAIHVASSVPALKRRTSSRKKSSEWARRPRTTSTYVQSPVMIEDNLIVLKEIPSQREFPNDSPSGIVSLTTLTQNGLCEGFKNEGKSLDAFGSTVIGNDPICKENHPKSSPKTYLYPRSAVNPHNSPSKTEQNQNNLEKDLLDAKDTLSVPIGLQNSFKRRPTVEVDTNPLNVERNGQQAEGEIIGAASTGTSYKDRRNPSLPTKIRDCSKKSDSTRHSSIVSSTCSTAARVSFDSNIISTNNSSPSFRRINSMGSPGFHRRFFQNFRYGHEHQQSESRRRRRSSATTTASSVVGSSATTASHKRSRHRLIVSSLGVILTYTISWLPYQMIALMRIICGLSFNRSAANEQEQQLATRDCIDSLGAYEWLEGMMILGACLNPFIYTLIQNRIPPKSNKASIVSSIPLLPPNRRRLSSFRRR